MLSSGLSTPEFKNELDRACRKMFPKAPEEIQKARKQLKMHRPIRRQSLMINQNDRVLFWHPKGQTISVFFPKPERWSHIHTKFHVDSQWWANALDAVYEAAPPNKVAIFSGSKLSIVNLDTGVLDIPLASIQFSQQAKSTFPATSPRAGPITDLIWKRAQLQYSQYLRSWLVFWFELSNLHVFKIRLEEPNGGSADEPAAAVVVDYGSGKAPSENSQASSAGDAPEVKANPSPSHSHPGDDSAEPGSIGSTTKNQQAQPAAIQGWLDYVPTPPMPLANFEDFPTRIFLRDNGATVFVYNARPAQNRPARNEVFSFSLTQSHLVTNPPIPPVPATTTGGIVSGESDEVLPVSDPEGEIQANPIIPSSDLTAPQPATNKPGEIISGSGLATVIEWTHGYVTDELEGEDWRKRCHPAPSNLWLQSTGTDVRQLVGSDLVRREECLMTLDYEWHFCYPSSGYGVFRICRLIPDQTLPGSYRWNVEREVSVTTEDMAKGLGIPDGAHIQRFERPSTDGQGRLFFLTVAVVGLPVTVCELELAPKPLQSLCVTQLKRHYPFVKTFREEQLRELKIGKGAIDEYF